MIKILIDDLTTFTFSKTDSLARYLQEDNVIKLYETIRPKCLKAKKESSTKRYLTKST